jgi:hypothetical protein
MRNDTSLANKYTCSVLMYRTHRDFGFSPSAPHYLLAKDERFNLALIGSLPHQSISQVRIHWLLDLITVRYNCNMFVVSGLHPSI